MSDTETHYLGRFLAMKSRNGWEYCERVNVSGVVVVIALTHDNQAILVEQFRPPVQSMVIEWPAGLVGDEAQARDERPSPPGVAQKQHPSQLNWTNRSNPVYSSANLGLYFVAI